MSNGRSTSDCCLLDCNRPADSNFWWRYFASCKNGWDETGRFSLRRFTRKDERFSLLSHQIVDSIFHSAITHCVKSICSGKWVNSRCVVSNNTLFISSCETPKSYSRQIFGWSIAIAGVFRTVFSHSWSISCRWWHEKGQELFEDRCDSKS